MAPKDSVCAMLHKVSTKPWELPLMKNKHPRLLSIIFGYFCSLFKKTDSPLPCSKLAQHISTVLVKRKCTFNPKLRSKLSRKSRWWIWRSLCMVTGRMPGAGGSSWKEKMKMLGYFSSELEPSLYYCQNKYGFIFIWLHVEDGFAMASSQSMLNTL